MFCSHCGAHLADGAHFCENCGAPLQVAGGVSQAQPLQQSPPMVAPKASTGRRSSVSKAADPYQQQISQLKLEIRQLKLDLKEINTQMGKVRSQYNQSSAFVPRGIFKRGYKEIEDMRLWGNQKKKQDLQQQIIQLEQQLLGLQQQQAQWKAQQG